MKLSIMVAFVGFLTIQMEWAQAKPVDAIDVTDTLLPEETPRDEKDGPEEESGGR